jgi:hypothetical protein
MRHQQQGFIIIAGNNLCPSEKYPSGAFSIARRRAARFSGDKIGSSLKFLGFVMSLIA